MDNKEAKGKNKMNGIKYDGGKEKWNLLPFDEVKDVVRVLTIGAKKYDTDNWKKVPDSKNRYFSAIAFRLLSDTKNGH